MTLLQHLSAHKGGLVRLKTQLYWYDRGGDSCEGRICLLLDAAAEATAAEATASRRRTGEAATTAVVAHLLIDGAPHWVWVAEADVELL